MPSDRIITLLIVPYRTPAQIARDRWEQIAPDALQPARRVTLMDEHRQSIGVARNVWSEADGLYGDFYVSRTARGDDILTLATDGALGVSPGFVPETVVELSEQLMEVRRGELREVTLTGVPAYVDSAVLSIRSAHTGGIMAEHDDTQTPPAPPANPDPAPAAPAAPATPPAPAAVEQRHVVDLEARLARLEDAQRASDDDDDEQPTPAISGRHRPYAFRSIGHLVTRVAQLDRGDTAEASLALDEIGSLLESGAIREERYRGRVVELRAFTAVGTLAETATPAGYVPELLELVRQGRVFSRFMAGRNLDDVPGATLQLPRVTQGAAVDYVGEAPTPAGLEVTQDLQTFPKATLHGGQGITVQARDWSSPAYLDTVVRDHLRAYGEKVNLEAAAGDGAVGPPAHHTGAVTLAATFPTGVTPPADATMAVIVPAIGLAKAAVFAATKRWPTVCFANGDQWGFMEGLVDSEGRPLLADPGDSQNAPGTMAGASPVGRLRGMFGYAEDSIPANSILIGVFDDSTLWESSQAPAAVSLLYPDAITIDVAVFGYSAVAHRRAGAWAMVTDAGANG